jgi:processive 1,2-diacylglycerol beta-glucosyltransferase
MGSSRPRILVLSASVGAGHLRAAQAVELALRQVAPDAFVRNVDVLTLTNPAFRKLYGEAYLDLVNHAPHVLGYVYDLMDRKPKRAARAIEKLRLVFKRLNLIKLCDLLQCDGERWDVIVNTHFLPAEIIAMLRRKRKIDTPQVVVTTDFETHRLWVHKPAEHYTAATEEGAAYLRHWGVTSQISVTGIPIHRVFAQEKDRNSCAKAHGLTAGLPTVLQLAGGFGVGPVKHIFEAILSMEVPLQLVVVCGRNKSVEREVHYALPTPLRRHSVKILGFTDKIDELMAAADVAVSKPGGLTTSETLARGCAMAIVNPIPGQESRNSDYLLENGAAIKINNLATLSMKLSALLEDRARLEQLKSNARRIAKPQAAFDVATLALKLATGNRNS